MNFTLKDGSLRRLFLSGFSLFYIKRVLENVNCLFPKSNEKVGQLAEYIHKVMEHKIQQRLVNFVASFHVLLPHFSNKGHIWATF